MRFHDVVTCVDPGRPRNRYLSPNVEVVPEDVRQVPLQTVGVLVRSPPHAVKDQVVLFVLLEIVHFLLKRRIFKSAFLLSLYSGTRELHDPQPTKSFGGPTESLRRAPPHLFVTTFIKIMLSGGTAERYPDG